MRGHRRALLVVGDPGADSPALSSGQLDLGLARGHQVVVPGRMLVDPALRGHENEVRPVGKEDQRRHPLRAALAADVV